MEIKMMPLKSIRLDGDTQIRSSLSTEKVVEYAEAMQDGDKFPPVVVFFDGSDHWLSSGFHRYFATMRLHQSEIEAEVREGTVEDARDFACEANARFGLPMTQEDRRNAVIRLLTSPNNNGWTNADIARRVGVSKMTVGRIKASLESKDKPEQPEQAVKDKKKPRKEKKGSAPEAPVQSEEQQQEEFQEQDRLAELSDTINDLTQENQKLRDAVALGQWDATEIEKIDVQETIEELREKIRVLEIENAALRDSRDMFQARNAELMGTVRSLQSKLKKLSPQET